MTEIAARERWRIEIQYEGWAVSGVAQGLKLESITGSWIAMRLVTWEAREGARREEKHDDMKKSVEIR